MKSDTLIGRLATFGVLASVFMTGFAVLAVRLRVEQLDRASEHAGEMSRQSFRRVQTAGLRGRIFDRNGTPLAVNRRSLNVVMHPEYFKAKRKGETPAGNIRDAIAALAPVIGREPSVSERTVNRHLRYELARPLLVWRDLSEAELARFAEHAREHPGFECLSEDERSYPEGTLAAHLIGRVGRESVHSVTGDLEVNYAEKDLTGREGLELRYDDYLRSMPGEDRVVVDARGFATERETLVEPRNGLDLTLTLDAAIQRAAERQLAGCRGACVVLDPRNGAILASASAPTFNPNDCVPVFRSELYERLSSDPGRPLLNRATQGTYAPGSTFKPVTALAGLGTGWPADAHYTCEGAFALGGMRIRCSRTWGHGPMDVAHALRESCNPFFCNLGMRTGTNALFAAARSFGLGARTGVDFPTDAAGVVPDGEWKIAHYREKWYPGDLAQMSIGQGMLLVTPLQMARVAGALGTGNLVTPRLNAAMPAEVSPLRFPERDMAVVREGMRMVVDGGTGRKAGEGVDANVIGKTGTAEVGRGASRRKNTWFIAYATPTETSVCRDPVAIAMVVENGESGGGTTAPKVAAVLRAIYNGTEDAGGV